MKRSLYEIANLIWTWHITKLHPIEKKFISEIIMYASEDDETFKTEQSEKQIAWLRAIGKRFLIT